MPRTSSIQYYDSNYLTSSAAQLKSNVANKLNYVNNVCTDLSEMVHKMHSENNDFKVLIGILMHFRHMFLYAKNNNFLQEDDIYEKLGIESTLFKNDLSQCMSQFNQIVEKCKSMKFAQNKDKYYENNRVYHPFLDDDLLSWKQAEKKRTETIEKHNLRRSVRQSKQWNGDVDRIEIGPDINFATLTDDDDNDWGVNDGEDYSDDDDFESNQQPKRTSTVNTADNSITRQRSSNVSSTPVIRHNQRSVIQTVKRKSNEVVDNYDHSYNHTYSTKRQNLDDCDDYCDEDEDDAYQPAAFKCPIEGCIWEPFDRKKDLNIHLYDGHGVAPFACLVDGCSIGFENRTSMFEHLKIHQNTYIRCERCQNTFQANNFYDHFKKKHRRKPDDCSNSEDFLFADPTQKRHDCSWHGCGKSFSSAKSLQDHIPSHATTSIHRARALVSGKRFRCKFENCELKYITDNRSHIIRHIRSRHLGLPRYLKDQIEKNIVDDRNVNDYFEIIDSIDVQPDNAQSTTNAAGLDNEIKHNCRWLNCDRWFHSKYELKEHLQYHITRMVTLYRCKTCSYESENKNHVLRHIRSRHFGLPRSYKEQIEKNIIDERNPYELMEIYEMVKAPPGQFQQQQPNQQLDSQSQQLIQDQELIQAAQEFQMTQQLIEIDPQEVPISNELNQPKDL